jgi:hypothetical protein
VTESEYERGVSAGEVLARLAGHDRHLASINGSLVKVAENGIDQNKAINTLALAVQRLADEFAASQRTLVITAQALEDARKARRDQSAQTWSPVAKVFTTLGALAVIVQIILGILAATK